MNRSQTWYCLKPMQEPGDNTLHLKRSIWSSRFQTPRSNTIPKKAPRLRERSNSRILDRGCPGQSHQSISLEPRKKVPGNPIHRRVDRSASVSGCDRPAGGSFLMSSLGSCHEPPNNYISLGRCGAGRVFMRYFGASGSLIHCRYCGGRSIRFRGTSQLV